MLYTFINPDIMVYYDMFVIAYSSSNGRRYMRVVEAVRRDGKVRHRHMLSLGSYEQEAFQRCRRIVAEWKPLERSALVLEELADDSGRLQGRGFFRSLRRW